MSAVKKHVLGFSPNSKLFALVDEQGILRIWDTETGVLKQEYTPNLHLTEPCTALTWVTMLAQDMLVEGGKKSKNSKKVSREEFYIALGTLKGHLSLYSYAEGKIQRKFKGEGHSGKITGIINDNAGKLYTCGDDCQIIVWSLVDECRVAAWQIGPEKPENITYLPKSQSLVVAARQIKVYSVQNQELLQTFTGHSSTVSCICSFTFQDTLEYAVTSAQMERIICLWKIGKKGRNKAAACTLLMEDIAHCLDCQIQDDGTLRVASVTRSGVIHIYLIKIESITSEKPIKPRVTLEIASDSSKIVEPIPALAAHFEINANRPHEILFAYGSTRFLALERLTPNYNNKMNVLVRTDPKKIPTKKRGNKEADTEVALKTQLPLVNYNQVEFKSALPVSKKKLQNDVPMESRLHNLNISSTTGPLAPQSQSKVQLLVQALHSKDAVLLRSVLCTKDAKTVKLTLQRLPVQYVGTLVNELTLLMQTKRVNVEYALLWLKMLTQTHSSQLLAMGADDLLNKFGPCLGIIEHRVNCLKEVSKLNGRLSLLVNQIKRNTEEDNLNDQNAFVLEDLDSPTPGDDAAFDYKDTVDNWSDIDNKSDRADDDNDEYVDTTSSNDNDNDDMELDV